MYCAPYDADHAVKIEFADGTITELESLTFDGTALYMGACDTVMETVLCAPCDHNYAMMINTTTDVAVEMTSLDLGDGSYKYIDRSCHGNGTATRACTQLLSSYKLLISI